MLYDKYSSFKDGFPIVFIESKDFRFYINKSQRFEDFYCLNIDRLSDIVETAKTLEKMYSLIGEFYIYTFEFYHYFEPTRVSILSIKKLNENNIKNILKTIHDKIVKFNHKNFSDIIRYFELIVNTSSYDNWPGSSSKFNVEEVFPDIQEKIYLKELEDNKIKLKELKEKQSRINREIEGLNKQNEKILRKLSSKDRLLYEVSKDD